MKKSLYIIAFAIVTILASSCTEENIQPQVDSNTNTSTTGF